MAVLVTGIGSTRVTGADMEQRDLKGRTALHLAAQYGHPASVTILIDRDVEADCRDDQGRTPVCMLSVSVSCLCFLSVSLSLARARPLSVSLGRDSR